MAERPCISNYRSRSFTTIFDKPLNVQANMKRITDKFGSREAALGYQLVLLSQFGQPADITFFNRDPIIDVTVDPQLALALA